MGDIEDQIYRAQLRNFLRDGQSTRRQRENYIIKRGFQLLKAGGAAVGTWATSKAYRRYKHNSLDDIDFNAPNKPTNLKADFDAEMADTPGNIRRGSKRARAETIADSLFSSESAYQTPVRGGIAAGHFNTNTVGNTGSLVVANKNFPTKFLNWKRFDRARLQLDDFLLQTIRWTEILQPSYADNVQTDANRRGVCAFNNPGYQTVWDGHEHLNNPASDALVATDETNYAGMRYMTTLSRTELESKYVKLSQTLNPLRNISETVTATAGSTNLPILSCENFIKKFQFTNVSNINVKLEFWDMLCIRDTDKSPLNIWVNQDNETQDVQPVTWQYGVNDSVATTTAPYVAYKPKIGSPGTRPTKKWCKQLFQYWHCISKKIMIIPAGGSCTIEITGDFSISGDKLYAIDQDGSGRSNWLQHISRMPLCFFQGEDGIVQPDSTSTPKNIGWNVPTSGKIFCSISQQGYYKAIPKNKNYVQIVTNWHDDIRKTDTTPASNDPLGWTINNGEIKVSTVAATVESVNASGNLLTT